MTQIATVERILKDGKAEISVARQSACSHDCGSCGGCAGVGQHVRVRAVNPIGAEPGNQVVVESSTRNLLGIAALVYLTPLAGFFLLWIAAAAMGLSSAACYGAGALGFCLGMVPALVRDRRVRRQGGVAFTIVRYF